MPPEQLWSMDWGGDLDFEYDHDKYWPALNDMCRARKEERRRRWEAGGMVVGESEEYLTGGTDLSIKGVKYDLTSSGRIDGLSERTGEDEVSNKLDEIKMEHGDAKPHVLDPEKAGMGEEQPAQSSNQTQACA